MERAATEPPTGGRSDTSPDKAADLELVEAFAFRLAHSQVPGEKAVGTQLGSLIDQAKDPSTSAEPRQAALLKLGRISALLGERALFPLAAMTTLSMELFESSAPVVRPPNEPVRFKN
jgi:hypothetical protein